MSRGLLLVLKHLRASTGWKLQHECIRRDLGVREDLGVVEVACPISSLMDRPARNVRAVGLQKKIPLKEIRMIVLASDNTREEIKWLRPKLSKDVCRVRSLLLSAAGLKEIAVKTQVFGAPNWYAALRPQD